MVYRSIPIIVIFLTLVLQMTSTAVILKLVDGTELDVNVVYMDSSKLVVSFARMNLTVDMGDVVYVLFDNNAKRFAETEKREGVFLKNGFFFQPKDLKISSDEAFFSSDDVILRVKDQRELLFFKPPRSHAHSFPKVDVRTRNVRIHPNLWVLEFSDGQLFTFKNLKYASTMGSFHTLESEGLFLYVRSDIVRGVYIPATAFPEYNLRVRLKTGNVVYLKFVALGDDSLVCVTPLGEQLAVNLADMESFEFMNSLDPRDLVLPQPPLGRSNVNVTDGSFLISAAGFSGFGNLVVDKGNIIAKMLFQTKEASRLKVQVEKYVQKWSAPLEVSWSVKAVDVDAGKRVLYAATADGFIVAMDFSGNLRWNSLPRYGRAIGLVVQGSAVVHINASGQVIRFSQQPDLSLKEEWVKSVGERVEVKPVVCDNGNVYVVTVSGNVFEVDQRGNIKRIHIDAKIVTAPTLVSSNSVCVADERGRLLIIGDGRVLHSVETKRKVASPVLVDADHNFYFGSQDGYFVGMRRDGALLWQLKTSASSFSTPVRNARGDIFVGTDRGELLSISREGKLNWVQDIGAPVKRAPLLTREPGGEFVYVLDETNWVSCFTQSGAFQAKLSGKIVFETDLVFVQDPNRPFLVFGAQGNRVGALSRAERALDFLWSNWLGSYKLSGAVLGPDGNIYVGSWDGNVYSFTPAGQLRWRVQLDGGIYTPVTIGPDGTIFVVSLNKVYALEPGGRLKWTQPFATRSMIYAPVVLGPRDSVLVAGMDRNLYALDANGKKLWEFAADNSLYAPPIVGRDGSIYALSVSGTVYCLSADGSRRWEAKTGLPSYSELLLTDKNELIFGALQGTLLGLDASSGSELFRRNLGTQIYSSLVTGSNAYFGTSNGLWRLNLQDRSVRQVLSTTKAIFVQPLVDSQNRIYVPCTDGVVYVVRGDEFLWKMEISTDLRSPLALSSDGQLHVLSTDGVLYCFQTVSSR